MRRRGFVLGAALLAYASALPLRASQAEPASGPAAPIQALNDGLVQVMQAGRAVPFAQRVAILTPLVHQAFDLPAILRNSIGPTRFDALPEAQRTTLLDLFTQFTVASYVANFDAFSGEKFVIAPDQRQVGTDMVVQTRIIPTSGDPTRLDYVMREGPEGWRVVDVLLDGTISRVAVTRSDFRGLITPSDASGLIASLRDKIAGLSGGGGK